MGKLIGAVLGFMVGGPLLALLGLVIGHIFDRGLGQAMRFNYGAEQETLQRSFFDTTFRIMGHVAKADGRVSESEIAQAEAIMTELGLTPERRRDAIARFKEGSAADFQLEPEIANFLRHGGRRLMMRKMLIEALLATALADGHIDSAERDILSRVAQHLGVRAADFDRLMRMAGAQREFHGYQRGGQYSGGAAPDSSARLSQAYDVLGVDATASDAEIKKAYRKLMSEHHPDKLAAKGLPDDMMKLATEKAQDIQAAYALIKEHRNKS